MNAILSPDYQKLLAIIEISSITVINDNNMFQCRLFDLRADRQVCVYEKESILFPVNGVDFSVSGEYLPIFYINYIQVEYYSPVMATIV